MDEPGFPARALAIRRAAARLCLRLNWAPLHEVSLPNGRRADILALRGDGGFACIEVKSGLRDFLTDQKWWEYREFADHLFFAARRTALLRRWAWLAGSRLAMMEDPAGIADLRASLRVE